MSEARLTCREVIEFLSDYVDGALDARTRAVFESHLSICPDCVSYVESYRETIRLGATAWDDEAEVSDEVPEDLVLAVLAARSKSST